MDGMTRRDLLARTTKVALVGAAVPVLTRLEGARAVSTDEALVLGSAVDPQERSQPLSLSSPARGFVSSRPAETWEEGLLCGNGTIGMVALSRPRDERIIFSHERLFMPMGEPVIPGDQARHLPEIRALIAAGKYKEASELQFKYSGQKSFLYPDFFVPGFDMTIRSDSEGEVRDYARSVDFGTGEAVVRWSDDRGVFERRMFVSRKDGVAVILLKGPKRGSLDCRLKLEPREPSREYNNDSDIAKHSDEMFDEHVGGLESFSTRSSFGFRCRYLRAYRGSIHTLESNAWVRVVGGSTDPQSDGALLVRGAEQVMILLDIRLLRGVGGSELASIDSKLGKIRAGYDALLARHAKVHGELFHRVRLDLGGGRDRSRTTEELLEASTFDRLNAALVEKEFDAGRYNILSSTGELPPNLQGLWGGTYVPGWASDYTHNGNLPSAIAANLDGNMPELMRAYTSYLESLLPALEVNAKHLFGARGIVLPSRSSTTGYNNALAPEFAGGMWVAGAGWAARFFYDTFLYTGDRTFLANHAYPFMEKATQFFEDYLYEGPDGRYIFSPTQSPENTPGNSDSQASFNATMDVAVAKELLRNTIEASRILGRNIDKVPMWERMLSKMPDYMINEDGLIKEWLTPALANADDHRHSSQLYALYFGMPEEIAARPDLQDAFRKSVEYKLKKHWKQNDRGYMSFGLVQLGQVSASLCDGELAYHCLRHLVNRFWLSNLASMHNQRSLLNMDISGGMPAVIMQMLFSSEPGKIKLLPALPLAWPKGSIDGVRCRGEIGIDRLAWDREPDGRRQIEVQLTSARKQKVSVLLPTEIEKIEVVDGKANISSGSPSRMNERLIELPSNRAVSLRLTLRGA